MNQRGDILPSDALREVLIHRLGLSVWPVCLICSVLVATGCQEEPPTPAVPATKEKPVSNPREQFGMVMGEVRKGVASMSGTLKDVGFSARLGPAHLQLIIDEITQPEFIEPTSPDDVLKARFTIRSRTIYTLPGSASSSDGEDARNDGKAASKDGPPSKPTSDERAALPTAPEPVVDEQEEMFEFAYRNGRWELISKDIQPSMRVTMEDALDAVQGRKDR